MENKVEVEMEKEWNDLDLHVNLSFYTKNLSIFTHLILITLDPVSRLALSCL